MGYGAVILVIGTIIISGILLLTVESATSDADEKVNVYHYKELARDAAVTGLELTVRRLAASAAGGSWDADFATTNTFNTTPYGKGGSFRVEIEPVGGGGGDLVDVTARGFNGIRYDVEAGETVPIAHVIKARYIREYADSGIPPAFRNAATADDLAIPSGSVEIRALNGTMNANTHTNDDLATFGNSFSVEGYGTYTNGDISSLVSSFVPNVDYNEAEPNVFWTESVDVPLIADAVITDLWNRAQTTSGSELNAGSPDPFIIDGDATPVIDFTSQGSWPWLLTFPYNCSAPPCGTKDNPFVLYVHRGLYIYNQVEFQGYGVIVVPGNVFIQPQADGRGMYGGMEDNDATLMLLTTEDLYVGEAGRITCLGLGPAGTGNPGCPSGGSGFTHGVTLYAKANRITFRGTTYLVGGVVAPEIRFEDNGAPTITYVGPAEAITDLAFDSRPNTIGPVLVAYSEW